MTRLSAARKRGDQRRTDGAGRAGHGDRVAADLTPSTAQVGLQRMSFSAASDGGEESAGVGTIDQTVVVGRRVADRHADGLVTEFVGDDAAT